MTLESPGYTYSWFEMTVSSTVRVWCEETRDERREVLDLPDREGEPVKDWKSDIDGILLSGGTNTVEREPVEMPLLLLEVERIVRIEPVGERVTEGATGRLTASLQERKRVTTSVSRSSTMYQVEKKETHQSLLTHFCLSNKLSAASLSTPSAYSM